MNIFSNVKSKLVIASTSLLLSASTFAAEGDTATSYAKEAMDALKAEATTLIGQVWPVVTTILVGLLTIRLVKKFASKAV
ncbi:capsid protein [Salmonella enterica]|nr:capsid protein [Salmonella enterica]EDM6269723.1 capsid protein [Salmonella enterica subsp. enterica serovar Muenchen]EAR4963919.1 capsid protein [Salmonella enterica]EAV8176452.1 capsid protein [Salmonella enterica]EBF1579888.1 capsid protein [Salmonella enterica]